MKSVATTVETVQFEVVRRGYDTSSVDTFLTSLDSEGLVKRGDSYYSLDWESAQYRVTVEVDAAFGSIDVVWVH